MKTIIRTATVNDTEQILEIYAPYVENTAITFEYDVPSLEEFHAHLGYNKVGYFQKCGYKFGRWYNMIWMEKSLEDGKDYDSKTRFYLYTERKEQTTAHLLAGRLS